jgi:hypothetical protein
MLNIAIRREAIYYGATRKCCEVVFDQALRARTLELVQQVRSLKPVPRQRLGWRHESHPVIVPGED